MEEKTITQIVKENSDKATEFKAAINVQHEITHIANFEAIRVQERQRIWEGILNHPDTGIDRTQGEIDTEQVYLFKTTLEGIIFPGRR